MVLGRERQMTEGFDARSAGRGVRSVDVQESLYALMARSYLSPPPRLENSSKHYSRILRPSLRRVRGRWHPSTAGYVYVVWRP